MRKIKDATYDTNSKEGVCIAKENKYVICDSYVIGYTKRGHEFYFDLEDFDVVKKYYWKIGSDGYIFASDVSLKLSLHKLIMGEGIYIHKNGNKKDNRKQNLIHVRGFKNSGKTFLNGYIAIYYPEHKRAFDNGCVYEHVLVAEKILGRPLNDDECVHHIDRDRTNNNESNLMIFATNQDHITYHAGGKAILQDNGVYKTNPLAIKFIYNNRTKEDIDNQVIDPGSITIINKMKYNLCPVCKSNLKSFDAVMCKSCRYQYQRQHIPPKEELERLIYNTPFTKIGEIYGVTDNAVRKWCKKYGLPFRKKDLVKY